MPSAHLPPASATLVGISTTAADATTRRADHELNFTAYLAVLRTALRDKGTDG